MMYIALLRVIALKNLIFLAMLATVVLLSLGCISSPEKKLEIPTLRIGYQTTTHHISEMAAAEKGWWTEDLKPFGVKEIKEFAYPSGTPEIQAMKAGDLDVVYICTSPVIKPISEGLDARIVAAVNTNGSNLVFKPGLKFSGPQSLVGLRIGTFPPGTAQDVILKKWLLDNGVNLSQVNITYMGPGDAVNAMSTGKEDGVFVPQAGPAIIELAGTGKSVLASGQIWPNHACCGIVVSGKLIRDYPELVKQIIRTQIKATDYINAHPEEAARIYSNHTGQPLNMVEYSLKTWDGKFISNPHDLINDTMKYAEFQYKTNYVKKEMTEKDLFDTSLYDNLK